jgi:nucleotide-binding universal stress UspA family protein
MIKNIVVNLSIGTPRDVAGDFAISVASSFNAHLSGIAAAYEPIVSGSVFDIAPVSALEQYRAENCKAAETARAAFETASGRAGISADARVINATVADAAGAFGRIARAYDLSIVAQARPDGDLPEELFVEAALFGSGRPVLVVPYIQKTGFKLDRVMVCWDGSRNAARAVADALPLLRRAGAVEVVTIDTIERRNEVPGADIAMHLARHDIKTGLKSIVDKTSDVASTILSYAADASTDLIVMGGYGHSRLREFVLGGATRGMLGAMTVPTLMAH